MKSTIRTSCISILLSFSMIGPSVASCLEKYYAKINSVKSSGSSATQTLGVCSALTTVIFWPAGLALIGTTGAAALRAKDNFNQYVRVKRLIQGAYVYLQKEIPFVQKGDKKEKEYLRKFNKYLKSLEKKSGLTGDQLAHIIVEADKASFLCPLDEKGLDSPLDISDVNKKIINGTFQDILGIPLTSIQQYAVREAQLKEAFKLEAQSKKEKKVKFKKQSKGYEKL